MKKCEACGHEPQRIKNVFELLQIIAAGVNKHHQVSICNLEVKLFEDDELVLTCGVSTMLDYFANDIYWNEENNWSNANLAEVSVL